MKTCIKIMPFKTQEDDLDQWIQVETDSSSSSYEEDAKKEKEMNRKTEKVSTEKEIQRLDSGTRVEMTECQVVVNDLCRLPSFKRGSQESDRESSCQRTEVKEE